MMTNRRRFGAAATLLLALVLIAGCNRGRREAEQRAQLAETRLAQMNTIATTKDSLMSELMATTSFISEINDELSRVKPAKGETTVTYKERVMPVAEYRTAMLTRIRELTARLDDSESRLASSQTRLRALTAKDKVMSRQIVAFDSMVAEYKTIVEDQRAQIELLNAQVTTLQTDNQRLAVEKTQLTEQVDQMTKVANTAYYIIGTKDELLEKGVARETGGSRFLGIGWRTGRALVPANELHEDAFRTLEKDSDFEIELPRADRKYAIVSPQDVQYVEPQPAKDGTWRGSIRIVDPEAFWAQSKFLIVVER